MKYTYEDFNNYTLEESLEILKKETKAKKIDAEDLIVDIEDELEVITHPESGETPTSFLFEFDKELDPYLGEIVVIKKEF